MQYFGPDELSKQDHVVVLKQWDSPTCSVGSPVTVSFPTMRSCPIPTMFIAFHDMVASRSSVQKQLRSWW